MGVSVVRHPHFLKQNHIMKRELRNYAKSQWATKSFDFLPYIKIMYGNKINTEFEIGWLCFAINFTTLQ